MGDDEADAWPEAEGEQPLPTEEGDNPDVDGEGKTDDAVVSTNISTAEPWTFPVRAAPILAMQGEEVTEFPLSQDYSGHHTTSLVVDDTLMRIVESSYDRDGIRRLNVRMALVKEHISGYSHTHLDLFRKLLPIWYSAIGFGALMWGFIAGGIPAIGGGLFIFAGLAGILLSQLDLHRISFSDHGGRHDFYLSGWRQNPYLIYNSMALLGPAFVVFLRTGELETEHIDMAVASLEAPPQPKYPHLNENTPDAISPAVAPLALSGPTSGATQTVPTPIQSLPPPPAPIANTIPPPPSAQSPPSPPSLPMTPMKMTGPPTTSLPPAPLPPAPLPPPMKQSIEDALWDDLV